MRRTKPALPRAEGLYFSPLLMRGGGDQVEAIRWRRSSLGAERLTTDKPRRRWKMRWPFDMWLEVNGWMYDGWVAGCMAG